MDSGAGGLPYLSAFAALNPRPLLLYAADTKNFPYGEKTKAGLVLLLTELTARIIKHFSPALVTVACNAASVSALAELRQTFPDTDFIGTVPAVKPALLASRKNHIAVIGTKRAVEDEYIQRIARNTSKNCAITRLAAPDLVDFAERRLDRSDKAERKTIVKKYVEAAREAGADALVLGCTHFLLLRDEFEEAAAPDIRIFDSVDGVCGRIEAVLPGKPAPPERNGRNLLLVTGGIDEQWPARAERYGLELYKPDGWNDT
jgi:glutamate racemase